jgi:hypothetical protein
MDVESLAGWIVRKVAVSNNRISDFDHLKRKVKDTDLLVLFVAPPDSADKEFRAYMKCAQALMHM